MSAIIPYEKRLAIGFISDEGYRDVARDFTSFPSFYYLTIYWHYRRRNEQRIEKI
jgi:hypothetical protein